MIRGEVYAYGIEDLNAAPGREMINRAVWVQGPAEKFDPKAIQPGTVLKYAEGRVHLKVLAVDKVSKKDVDCRIVCGVLEPSTRRGLKLLQVLPWWERKYADESEFL